MLADMDISPKNPKGGLTLARVLAILRDEETALRQRGIVHAGVFGSVARGDDTPMSDVDILVEIDYATGFGTIDLMDVEERLAGILGRRVDLVSAGGLRPGKHDPIRRDAVPAF
ncbi:MAG: hypothetical protein JWM87_2764 [Candidatus Eremiobacteraeota bacterium]|nr:hypothetical protein [Candidatus Eremiobacteraeota bacterium]